MLGAQRTPPVVPLYIFHYSFFIEKSASARSNAKFKRQNEKLILGAENDRQQSLFAFFIIHFSLIEAPRRIILILTNQAAKFFEMFGDKVGRNAPRRIILILTFLAR